nr:copper amine oxidase N-terminal domain-containing protein [uncultured Criibacterium sp.]
MKNFKRILFSLLLIFSIAGVTTSFAAPSKVKVIVNGAELKTDTPAVIRNSRTMVPFRALFEALGLNTITWDEPTQKVIGSNGTTTIELVIGSYDIYVNGTPVTMDTPPIIINSRTMIPLSFVSKSTGADVKWDGKNYIATVTQPNQAQNSSPAFPTVITDLPSSQVISNPTVLDGYYAMEDLSRNKYVVSYQAGAVTILKIGGGQAVTGTYTFDGTTLTLKAGTINGTFTKEDVNYSGKNILFMKDNNNPNAGQSFAMVKTTKEDFDKYALAK